eukprot:TRINITY_DN2040_c2_g2_i1.p1 TRINITY_DN2040_c2_g2~~TRINITY_DN2040_c2_g2_i1.p1  ORF type:complete len:4797 (+),score=1368.97 TRINITY_DN2040_c2_g2_i1:1018-14391(+)
MSESMLPQDSGGDGALSRGVRFIRSRGQRFVSEAKLAFFGDADMQHTAGATRRSPLTELEQVAQCFGVIVSPDGENARHGTAFRFIYHQDTPGPLRVEVRKPSELPKSQLEVDIFARWINYGPFIDHVRGRVQQAFFPWDYRTYPVYKKNATAKRQYGAFEVCVRFCSPKTTIAMPFKQKLPTPNPPTGIAAGSGPTQEMHITFGEGSRIVQLIPYVQMHRREGPLSEVMILLHETNWWTTVNSADWIVADQIRIHLDITYPSEYVHNEKQQWDVGFVVSDGEMWYNSEHMNFIFDMIADWGYANVTYLGEPFNYGGTNTLEYFTQRYIPYVQRYEFFFQDGFDVHFIVNDGNVIQPGTHNSTVENTVLTLRVHDGIVEYVCPFDSFTCAQENEAVYQFLVDLKECEMLCSLSEGHECAEEARSGPPVFCTVERMRCRGTQSAFWPNCLRAQGNPSWRPTRDHRKFREKYPRRQDGLYWGDLRPPPVAHADTKHVITDQHVYRVDMEKVTAVLLGHHARYMANWWSCYFGEECAFVDPAGFTRFSGWSSTASLGRNLRYLHQQWQALNEYKWKTKNVTFELNVKACQLYVPLTPGCLTVFQAEAETASSVSPHVPFVRSWGGNSVLELPVDELVHVIGGQGEWARVRRERIGWVRRRRLEQILEQKRHDEAAVSSPTSQSWQRELPILCDYCGVQLNTAAELHDAFRRFREDEVRKGVVVKSPFEHLTAGRQPLAVLLSDELTKLQEDGGAGGDFALVRWRSVGWVGIKDLRYPHTRLQRGRSRRHPPPARYKPRPPGFWRVEGAERGAGSAYEGSADFADISFFEQSFTYSGTAISSDITVSLTPLTLRVFAGSSPGAGRHGLPEDFCLSVAGAEYHAVSHYQEQPQGEVTPFLPLFHSRTRVTIGNVTGHLLVQQIALLEQIASSFVRMWDKKDPHLLEDSGMVASDLPIGLFSAAAAATSVRGSIPAGGGRRGALSSLPPARTVPTNQGSRWVPTGGQLEAFQEWVEKGEKDARDAAQQAYSFTTADIGSISVAVRLGAAGKTDPVEFDGYVSLSAQRGLSYARTTLNDGDAGPSVSSRNTTVRWTATVPQIFARVLREKGVTAGGHGEYVEVGSATAAVRVRASEARRWAGRDAHEHFQMQKRFVAAGFDRQFSGVDMDAHAPEALRHPWPLPDLHPRWKGAEQAHGISLASSLRSVGGHGWPDYRRRSVATSRSSFAETNPEYGRRRSAPASAIHQAASGLWVPMVAGEALEAAPPPARDLSRESEGLELSPSTKRSTVGSDAVMTDAQDGEPRGEAVLQDDSGPPTPQTADLADAEGGQGMLSCDEYTEEVPQRVVTGSVAASPSVDYASQMHSCLDISDEEDVATATSLPRASSLRHPGPRKPGSVPARRLSFSPATSGGLPPPVPPVPGSRLEQHRPTSLLEVPTTAGCTGGEADKMPVLPTPQSDTEESDTSEEVSDEHALEGDMVDASPLLGACAQDMVKSRLSVVGVDGVSNLLHGQGDTWGDARYASALPPEVAFVTRSGAPQRRHPQIDKLKPAAGVDVSSARLLLAPSASVETTENMHDHDMTTSSIHITFTDPLHVHATPQAALLAVQSVALFKVHRERTSRAAAAPPPPGPPESPRRRKASPSPSPGSSPPQSPAASMSVGPMSPRRVVGVSNESIVTLSCAEAILVYVHKLQVSQGQKLEQPRGTHAARFVAQRIQGLVTRREAPSLSSRGCPSFGASLRLYSVGAAVTTMQRTFRAERLTESVRLLPDSLKTPLLPSGTQNANLLLLLAATVQHPRGREHAVTVRVGGGDVDDVAGYGHTAVVNRKVTAVVDTVVAAAGADAGLLLCLPRQITALIELWQHADRRIQALQRQQLTSDVPALPTPLTAAGAATAAAPSPLSTVPGATGPPSHAGGLSVVDAMREFNSTGDTEGLKHHIFGRAEEVVRRLTQQQQLLHLRAPVTPAGLKSSGTIGDESFDIVPNTEFVERQMQREQVSDGSLHSRPPQTPPAAAARSAEPSVRMSGLHVGGSGLAHVEPAPATPPEASKTPPPCVQPEEESAERGFWMWLAAGDRIKVNVAVDQMHGSVTARTSGKGSATSKAGVRRVSIRAFANDPAAKQKARDAQEPGDDSVRIPVAVVAQVQEISVSAAASAVTVFGSWLPRPADQRQPADACDSPSPGEREARATFLRGRRRYVAWFLGTLVARRVVLEASGVGAPSAISVTLPSVRMLATNRPKQGGAAAAQPSHRPRSPSARQQWGEVSVGAKPPGVPAPPAHLRRRSYTGDMLRRDSGLLATQATLASVPEDTPVGGSAGEAAGRPVDPPSTWTFGFFTGATSPLGEAMRGAFGSADGGLDGIPQHVSVTYRCQYRLRTHTVFTVGVRTLHCSGVVSGNDAPAVHVSCDHPVLRAQDYELLASRECLNLWQGMVRDWADAFAQLSSERRPAPESDQGFGSPTYMSPPGDACADGEGFSDRRTEGSDRKEPESPAAPPWSALTVCVDHMAAVINLPLSQGATVKYSLKRFLLSDIDTGAERVLRVHVHPSALGSSSAWQSDKPQVKLPAVRVLYARGGERSRLEVWADRVETAVSTDAVGSWLRLYRVAAPGVFKWLEVGSREEVQTALQREALSTQRSPPIDLVSVVWAGVRITAASPAAELCLSSGMGVCRTRTEPVVSPADFTTPLAPAGSSDFPRVQSAPSGFKSSPGELRIQIPHSSTDINEFGDTQLTHRKQWFLKLPHVSLGLYDVAQPPLAGRSGAPGGARGRMTKESFLKACGAMDADEICAQERPRLTFRWCSFTTAISAGNVDLDDIKTKRQPPNWHKRGGSGDRSPRPTDRPRPAKATDTLPQDLSRSVIEKMMASAPPPPELPHTGACADSKVNVLVDGTNAMLRAGSTELLAGLWSQYDGVVKEFAAELERDKERVVATPRLGGKVKSAVNAASEQVDRFQHDPATFISAMLGSFTVRETSLTVPFGDQVYLRRTVPRQRRQSRRYGSTVFSEAEIPTQALQIYIGEASLRMLAEPETELGRVQGRVPTRVIMQLALREALAYFSSGYPIDWSKHDSRRRGPERRTGDPNHPWRKAARGQGGGYREDPFGSWWYCFGRHKGQEFSNIVGGVGLFRPASKEGYSDSGAGSKCRIGGIKINVRARYWSDNRVELQAKCVIPEGPEVHVLPNIVTCLRDLPADFAGTATDTPPEAPSPEAADPRSRLAMADTALGGVCDGPEPPDEEDTAKEFHVDGTVKIACGTVAFHTFGGASGGGSPSAGVIPDHGSRPHPQTSVFKLRTPRLEARGHFRHSDPGFRSQERPVSKLQLCLCLHAQPEPVCFHPTTVWFASELAEWRKQAAARREERTREIFELVHGLRDCLREGLRQQPATDGAKACRLTGSACLVASLDDSGEVCINGHPLIDVLLPRPASLRPSTPRKPAAVSVTPRRSPVARSRRSSPRSTQARRDRAKRVRLVRLLENQPADQVKAPVLLEVKSGTRCTEIAEAVRRQLNIAQCWLLDIRDDRGRKVCPHYDAFTDGHVYAVRPIGLSILVSLSIRPFACAATVEEDSGSQAASPAARPHQVTPELLLEVGAVDTVFVRSPVNASTSWLINASVDKGYDRETGQAVRLSVKERRASSGYQECLSVGISSVGVFAVPALSRMTVHVRGGQDPGHRGTAEGQGVRAALRGKNLRNLFLLRQLWKQKWEEAAAVLEQERSAHAEEARKFYFDPVPAVDRDSSGSDTESVGDAEAQVAPALLSVRVDCVNLELENMRMDHGMDGVCRDKVSVQVDVTDMVVGKYADRAKPESPSRSPNTLSPSVQNPALCVSTSSGVTDVSERRGELARAAERLASSQIAWDAFQIGVGRVHFRSQGNIEAYGQEVTRGVLLVRGRRVRDADEVLHLLQQQVQPYAKLDVAVPKMAFELRSEHDQMCDVRVGEDVRAGMPTAGREEPHAGRVSCAWHLSQRAKATDTGGSLQGLHARCRLTLEQVEAKLSPTLFVQLGRMVEEAAKTQRIEEDKALEQLRPQWQRGRWRDRDVRGRQFKGGREASSALEAVEKVEADGSAAQATIPFLGSALSIIPRGHVSVRLLRRFRLDVRAADKELSVSARGGGGRGETPACVVEFVENLRRVEAALFVDKLKQMEESRSQTDSHASPSPSPSPSDKPLVPPHSVSPLRLGPFTDDLLVGRIDRLAHVLIHDWSVGITYPNRSEAPINLLSAPGTSMMCMETNQFVGDGHVFYDFASHFPAPWELGQKGRSVTPDIQQLKSWVVELVAEAQTAVHQPQQHQSQVPGQQQLQPDHPQTPARVYVWTPKERRRDRDDRRVCTKEEFVDRARRERRKDAEARWSAALKLPQPVRGDFSLSALPGHAPVLNIHAGGDFDLGKLLQLADLQESALPHGVHSGISDALEALLAAAFQAAAPADAASGLRAGIAVLRGNLEALVQPQSPIQGPVSGDDRAPDDPQ